jgi:cystathionine beta-synthase
LNDTNKGNNYVVEGIGYDFIPQVLAREKPDVDCWIKTSDDEAFDAVRRLMRSEGLLVGGSSGSALSGALKWLKTDEVGKRVASTAGSNVVILLPDGSVYYYS